MISAWGYANASEASESALIKDGWLELRGTVPSGFKAVALDSKAGRAILGELGSLTSSNFAKGGILFRGRGGYAYWFKKGRGAPFTDFDQLYLKAGAHSKLWPGEQTAPSVEPKQHLGPAVSDWVPMPEVNLPVPGVNKEEVSWWDAPKIAAVGGAAFLLLTIGGYALIQSRRTY